MDDPTPLDAQQFADIRAREAAATQGPWGMFEGSDYADIATGYQQTGRGSYTCRHKVARVEAHWALDDPACDDLDDEEAADQAYVQAVANAEFVTHAREDIPALLAEVDRLREQHEASLRRAAVLDLTQAGGPHRTRHPAAHPETETTVNLPTLTPEQSELRDRRTEDEALRGTLSPNGEPRRVPMELGPSLVPAVEWLLAELDRLRALVTDMHAAATGSTLGFPLLGYVDDMRGVRESVVAQRHRADVLDRLCRERDAEVARLRARVAELETAAEARAALAEDDGDELVHCARPHCSRSEWYARLAERGWEPSGMGQWLDPQCAADAADRRDRQG